MSIIYDARRIKAYEKLKMCCMYTGKSDDFRDELWLELLSDGELMTEFVYYLDNDAILDKMKCEGYGLIDIYFHLLEQCNIRKDFGRDDAGCDKMALVLDMFLYMAKMKKNPEEYIRRMNEGFGMDTF